MHCLHILFWLFILHYAGATTFLQWPKQYNFKATLNIPSANLSQPYEVWANGVTGNLRFDFYNGMTKMYKKQNKNNFKVPFRYYWVGLESSSIIQNRTVCRKLTNTSREARLINSYLLTSTDKYKLQKIGKDVNGTTKWELKYSDKYGAIYQYTVWTSDTKQGSVSVPVRYEYRMMYHGVELDFRQHLYGKFIVAKPVAAVFKIPKDLQCKAASAFSDERLALISYSMDSIPENNISEMFERFKSTHKKQYKTEQEHFDRFNIFQRNYRYIQHMNHQKNSYKLAVNHLADRTEEELSKLLATKMEQDSFDTIPFQDDYEDSGNFDWRWYNASSPVKDQTGLCGSCYAFATAAAVESASYISKGCKDMQEASEQALIDCSRGSNGNGNDGCNGGFLGNSLKWVNEHGIPLRNDYGPYLAMEGYCNMDQPRFLHINGYSKVLNAVKSVKDALRVRGPLAAVMNVPASLFYYSSGIYEDKSCLSDPRNMTHAIVIVGFGKENGLRYWVIKNSWGSNWGDGGYFKVNMDNNLCGITNGAYSVVYQGSKVKECKKHTLV